MVKLVTFGVELKGQIPFTFNYKVNFRDILYQTFHVSSQIKGIKHIQRDFQSVSGVMPQEWNLGVGIILFLN